MSLPNPQLLEKVSQMATEVNCNEATEEFNVNKNRYPDRLPCTSSVVTSNVHL